MEKIFLFFIGLVFALNCGSAAAQDTVSIKLRDSNYYYSPYGCQLDSLLKNVSIDVWFGWYDTYGVEKETVFRTDSALTVYGIVAGLMEPFPEEPCYDTSFDRSIEYLRLYLPTDSAPNWVRQARVHLHHTPISYYADFSSISINGQYTYVPMYERYFDSAVTVTGKFYCGLTYSAQHPYIFNGHYYMYEFPDFSLVSITGLVGTHSTYSCRDTVGHFLYMCDGSESWMEGPAWDSKAKFLIFPLLTPPDSTYAPDTLSADGPSLADRMTGVMPNPASESIKVVSSSGMNYIEIYNAAGTKVVDQPTMGYSTTVDTSRLPAGIYIVRIHTPYGMAIKRLSIVR